MPKLPKLVFFSGSNSSHSLNALLAKEAARLAAVKGAEISLISLADYPLPLYDPDLHEAEGLPENALALKATLQKADGAFIASPEYNGGFTPVLKNAVDWVSLVRKEGEPMMPAFSGKVYAIASASRGGLGGLRGLMMLRMLLGHIGITVVPSQVAVGHAQTAFCENGTLKDERQALLLDNTVDELVRFAAV